MTFPIILLLATLNCLVIPEEATIIQADDQLLADDAMRALFQEIVKSQILEKLNLKEPPHPSQAMRRVSKEVIRLLAKEADDQFQKEHPKEEDSVVLYTNNSDFRCFERDLTLCKRFEFVLPSTLISASGIDLWFYKQNKTIQSSFLSVFCSDIPENIFQYQVSPENETEVGWIKVELPKELVHRPEAGDLVFQIEANGLEVTEDGDRRPFLLVVKNSDIAGRKRRSNDGNNTCQRKPFTVKFSDIGFDSFILEPRQYDAYFCGGECWKDRSNSRSFYQTVITETFERNKTLVDTYGLCWASCCRPTRFSHLHVLYADENYIHNKKLTNMIVESCGCS